MVSVVSIRAEDDVRTVPAAVPNTHTYQRVAVAVCIADEPHSDASGDAATGCCPSLRTITTLLGMWVLLVAAVAGLASKGPVARSMYPSHVSPVLVGVWMTGVSLVGFLFLAFYDVYRVGGSVVAEELRSLGRAQSVSLLREHVFGIKGAEEEKPSSCMLPWFGACMVLLASVMHGMSSAFFLLSLSYTTLDLCMVFMNLHPVLVLMSRFGRSNAVEKLGACVVTIGIAALCYSRKSTEVASNLWLGNGLALCVSFFMWVYLSLSPKLQAEVQNGVLMSMIYAGSFTTQLVFLLAADGWPTSLFYTGIAHYWLANLLGGLAGGCLAYYIFMVSTKVLNPLVVSVHITLEPLFASIIALFTPATVPSWKEWSSLSVMLAGSILVVCGGMLHSRLTASALGEAAEEEEAAGERQGLVKFGSASTLYGDAVAEGDEEDVFHNADSGD